MKTYAELKAEKEAIEKQMAAAKKVDAQKH